MSPTNLREDPTEFEILMETIEARTTVLHKKLHINEDRAHQYMFNVQVEDLPEDEQFVLMEVIPALSSAILPDKDDMPEDMNDILNEIDQKAIDADCNYLSPVDDDPPSNEYLVDLTARLRSYILVLEAYKESIPAIKQRMVEKMPYVIANIFLQINHPIPYSLLELVDPEDIEFLNTKTAAPNEKMNQRLLRFLKKYPDPSVLVNRLFEEHGEPME